MSLELLQRLTSVFLQILVYAELVDTVHMYTKLRVSVCPSGCVTVLFGQ